MSPVDIDRGPRGSLRAGLDALHRDWGWYLALGIALVIVGMIFVSSPVAPTIAAVFVFGVLMIVSGIGQLAGAFWARYWSGMLLSVLSGVLYLVVGVATLRHPGTADIALTLLIAAFLMIGGLFRIIGSVSLQFHGWIWSAISGAISTLLGIAIYASMPFAGLVVIGTLIGIDMIFQGSAWIALAMALRSRPARVDRPTS